jgi:hypothetical protein
MQAGPARHSVNKGCFRERCQVNSSKKGGRCRPGLWAKAGAKGRCCKEGRQVKQYRGRRGMQAGPVSNVWTGDV